LKYTERARAIIDIEIEGLRNVAGQLGEEFDAAIERILSSLNQGGKIIVSGIGKNLPIGRKIAATLTSTGAPAVVLHPLEAMHGDLGILQKTDVLLALSYSGESEELSDLLPLVRRYGVPVIALTRDRDSSLARLSDITIPVPVEREACPFNMAPTASTTATLAVGDAIAMILLEARGFQKEDFAQLHPGGAIGRTLLMRVADIMRSDDRIASVHRDATVRDAILAMTSARSGSVAVIDDDQHVVGIFTDGDLRRHVTDDNHIVDEPIASFMTPDPITLTCDHLAVDVLTIYEKHNIDDLIIVDENGRLAGMIDIQDLPKFKIF
jgi:arabinose-5-phosphate isomerase